MRVNKVLTGALCAAAAALMLVNYTAYAGGGYYPYQVPMAPAAQAPGISGGIPQISVVGVGVEYTVPDIAAINIGVRSQADTVTEALALNNSQAIAVRDTLIAQGVKAEDIQTTSFNVLPQSEYIARKATARTYFSVENYVLVTVRKLESLGDILDAVADSGANNIYGITFEKQDKSAAESSARSLAIESARAQAQELAAAAGVELGNLLMVSSTSSYIQQYIGIGGRGSDEAKSATVPIAAGQIQVTAQVSMIFRIKE